MRSGVPPGPRTSSERDLSGRQSQTARVRLPTTDSRSVAHCAPLSWPQVNHIPPSSGPKRSPGAHAPSPSDTGLWGVPSRVQFRPALAPPGRSALSRDSAVADSLGTPQLEARKGLSSTDITQRGPRLRPGPSRAKPQLLRLSHSLTSAERMRPWGPLDDCEGRRGNLSVNCAEWPARGRTVENPAYCEGTFQSHLRVRSGSCRSMMWK